MNEIIKDITFKSLSYRKNFNLSFKDEHLITNYLGTITLLQIVEKKPPLLIGEYSFSTIDLKVAKFLDVDIFESLKTLSTIGPYNQLYDVLLGYGDEIYNYNKIIVLETLILRKEFRKKEISEEFIESVYRDVYGNDCIMFGFFVPIQYNDLNSDYFLKERVVKLKNDLGDGSDFKYVETAKYYSLNEFLIDGVDKEYSEYKIFSIATRLGFIRTNDNTSVFRFNNESLILNRIKEKDENDYPNHS
jgi:hypothetical protein